MKKKKNVSRFANRLEGFIILTLAVVAFIIGVSSYLQHQKGNCYGYGPSEVGWTTNYCGKQEFYELTLVSFDYSWMDAKTHQYGIVAEVEGTTFTVSSFTNLDFNPDLSKLWVEPVERDYADKAYVVSVPNGHGVTALFEVIKDNRGWTNHFEKASE